MEYTTDKRGSEVTAAGLTVNGENGYDVGGSPI